MSLKHTKDIEKLFKLAEHQAKRIDALEEQARYYKLENEWMKEQMRTGLTDVINRVVKDTIEVELTEKTDDEKLTDLLNNQ